MKHDCEIVRDLMPLAVDGTASERSRAMVDEHIAECEDCREMYGEMRQEVVAEPPVEEAGRLVRKLRWRRLTRVLLLVLLGIALSLVMARFAWQGWHYFCNSYVVLTEESDYTIELVPRIDGQVYIYPNRLNGRGQVLNCFYDEETGDLYIWSSSTRWNRASQPVWAITENSTLYYDPELGYAERMWVGPEGPDHSWEMMLVNRIYKGAPDWFVKDLPHSRTLLYERADVADEAAVAQWFEEIMTDWQEPEESD